MGVIEHWLQKYVFEDVENCIISKLKADVYNQITRMTNCIMQALVKIKALL